MKPLLHRLLIELDSVEEITSGGIVLPKELIDKEGRASEIGTIVAIGDKAFTDFGFSPEYLQVGDRVVIARYAGKSVSQENKRLVVINDEDCLIKLGD